jgi:MFS family permease
MCSQYIAQHSASDFTIVAALELYCDKQPQRTLIQSISAAGAIVGVLSISFISDIKGRRFGILFAQFIAIISVCCITFYIE